jgi:hypothetical protein
MMSPASALLARLQAHWVYGGALAGLLLLLLTPLFARGWTGPETLSFLALPAYMLHQYEEHDADRFRQFVNRTIGGGREALTVADVFWINIAGVWLTLALGLWAMLRLDTGWGVFAAWFILVNAAAHLAQAAALRRPNPGVWTGAFLFLPLSLAILSALAGTATLAQHLVTLALVLALHAAILVRVRSNLARTAA